jgi:hypothetical protein
VWRDEAMALGFRQTAYAEIRSREVNMLYKYCPVSRFFDNGLIRFTQPGGLNDPDDVRPEILIGKYAPEDYAQARIKAQQAGLRPMPDKRLEALFMNPFPSRRFDEKSFPGLWPHMESRLRDKPFSSLDELDAAVAERAIELCLSLANSQIGVLSLSSVMSEAMWAYYADSHVGIVVGFDEEHSFFKSCRPIVYSDDPIHVSSNFGWVRVGGIEWDHGGILDGKINKISDDLFFRKRSGWTHEQEWRMIRPLTDAYKVIGKDMNGYDIHLFEVPSDAVRKVIFGYRTGGNIVEDTIEKIKKGPWKQIEIVRRERLNSGKVIEKTL